MTPGTIRSYGLFVHIGVAVAAGCLCFGKIEGFVAFHAINSLMLTNKRELSNTVVEGNVLQIHFPSIGFMAIVAVGFKTITMGRFLG
jgi:hypothetical protein